MNCVLLTLSVLILIVNLISAKRSCSDACTTTTYCLSTEGTSCSSDTLVTSTWSVRRTADDDLVTLTLKAKNVNQGEYRTLSMAFKSATLSTSSTNYTCFKSGSDEVSSSVIQISTERTETIQTAPPNYSGGVLTCSWSFTMTDNTWPLYIDGGAQLMQDNRGSLELRSGYRSEIVADNVGNLPTYQLQYLKCCNNAHGNDGYLAIFNQTTDNNYLLRMIGRNPNTLTLSLNTSNGMRLIFNCYFKYPAVEGILANGTRSTVITKSMYNIYAHDSTNPQCSWSHPLQLNSGYGNLDTFNQLFDIQIISDGTLVYNETGVNLRNSASPCAYNSLILVLVAISMKLLIQ